MSQLSPINKTSTYGQISVGFNIKSSNDPNQPEFSKLSIDIHSTVPEQAGGNCQELLIHRLRNLQAARAAIDKEFQALENQLSEKLHQHSQSPQQQPEIPRQQISPQAEGFGVDVPQYYGPEECPTPKRQWIKPPAMHRDCQPAHKWVSEPDIAPRGRPPCPPAPCPTPVMDRRLPGAGPATDPCLAPRRLPVAGRRPATDPCVPRGRGQPPPRQVSPGRSRSPAQGVDQDMATGGLQLTPPNVPQPTRAPDQGSGRRQWPQSPQSTPSGYRPEWAGGPTNRPIRRTWDPRLPQAGHTAERPHWVTSTPVTTRSRTNIRERMDPRQLFNTGAKPTRIPKPTRSPGASAGTFGVPQAGPSTTAARRSATPCQARMGPRGTRSQQIPPSASSMRSSSRRMAGFNRSTSTPALSSIEELVGQFNSLEDMAFDEIRNTGEQKDALVQSIDVLKGSKKR